jgi:dienelactone hydrolase
MRQAMTKSKTIETSEVEIRMGKVRLNGDLTLPPVPRGLVLFAHGSGSSRLSPRNRSVAGILNEAGFATLLMDLLTEVEDAEDQLTGELRFDVKLLAGRLIGATEWLASQKNLSGLPVGYFGASTGAAAALIAASGDGSVKAVVSRGGRPDLAGASLKTVRTPTLLIVGGEDYEAIDLNRMALKLLGAQKKELCIVPGATHLFEEPGTLKLAADHATRWFNAYLKSDGV